MIRGALGVIAALLLVGGAQAQEAPKTPPAASAVTDDKAAPEEIPQEITSPLVGGKFLYPAYPLADDGTYREALDAIAGLEKYKCANLEAYGWTFNALPAGEAIFTATMHDVENAGFSVRKVTIEQFKDKRIYPLYAVGKRGVLLLLWVIDDDAAQLSLCDVTPKS